MQVHNETTTQVCTSLFWHLSNKGLDFSTVNRLMQDIFGILQDGGTFTVGLINTHLNEMGWTEVSIDEATVELALTLLKNEFKYSVHTHMIH